MDNLRGQFSDSGEPYDRDYDPGEDEIVREPPPAAIGQDERRMQVRAYNFWAGLLDDTNLPLIEDLDPAAQTDFGPFSVLLDFTSGIENPAIAYLGDKLAEECGTDGPIERLGDVPSRSLLSRITDHYLQILANQAPIGFEAEFVNQRGATILYRGILLPFSSDADTIDFIYGVINWKELADQQTTDELMLEIDQALAEDESVQREALPMADWADTLDDDDDILDLDIAFEEDEEPEELPEPSFSVDRIAPPESNPFNTSDYDFAIDGDEEPDEEDGYFDDDEEEEEDEEEAHISGRGFASLTSLRPGGSLAGSSILPGPLDLSASQQLDDEDEAGFEDEPEAEAEAEPVLAAAATDDTPSDQVLGGPLVHEPDESEMELADWLASARDYAEAARASEDRSRKALYAAIGRAYDFSLVAAAAPGEFAELVEECGLVMQDRSPLTPLAKLVFGIDYDKTRLAEIVSVLGHAARIGIGRGALADHLAATRGGLKALVAEERRLRRVDAGQQPAERTAPRNALARKLRKLAPRPIETLSTEGSEFTVLLARRLDSGEVVILGEVGDDVQLVERAARKLLG